MTRASERLLRRPLREHPLALIVLSLFTFLSLAGSAAVTGAAGERAARAELVAPSTAEALTHQLRKAAVDAADETADGADAPVAPTSGLARAAPTGLQLLALRAAVQRRLPVQATPHAPRAPPSLS